MRQAFSFDYYHGLLAPFQVRSPLTGLPSSERTPSIWQRPTDLRFRMLGQPATPCSGWSGTPKASIAAAQAPAYNQVQRRRAGCRSLGPARFNRKIARIRSEVPTKF